ncbi:MAG: OmpA family protein [Deltaproteobacteria bacterium]|nr:OmpA family protein [Deltaproteobacteria bacterium]
MNGYQDDDGCPDTGRAVTFTENELVSQRIFFDFNRASLKPTSEEALQEVAQAMIERTEIQKFEIRGHTDNVGTSAINKMLSLKRANVVRDFLFDEGVDKGRLITKGFGSTRPIVSNKTEGGRAKNRRVEFFIIKDGKAVGPGQLEEEEKVESKPSVGTPPPASETAPQEETQEEPDLLVR